MKKGTLIHTELSAAIARSGHNDRLVIGDAGLPVPSGPRFIDLALTNGIASFLDTLRVVLSELQVERIIVAEETRRVSPAVWESIQHLLPNVPVDWVSHEEFKAQTAGSRAFVRTGEYTPYANIILVAGVVF
jgi:D-ribose pyranase